MQRYNTVGGRCGLKSVCVGKHPIKHEKVGQSGGKYSCARRMELNHLRVVFCLGWKNECARRLAKAKRNEGIGKKKSDTISVPLLMFMQRYLLYCCGLFDLCAHDGVYPTFAEDEDLIIAEDFSDRC